MEDCRQLSACTQLSKRQIEVLKLVAEGRTTQEIAADLGVSIHTVRNHVRQIRYRLRARDKLQAVMTGLRIGLIDPPWAAS